MSIIKQLPPHEAQKIAAGEVVERPANVVKELIENALDAGATKITLDLVDAGKQHIKIVDNGCGMTPEDAHLCTQQHATSKISCVDDLSNIGTFGFRGEALASIAAVSHLQLFTRHTDTKEGVKLVLHGGTLKSETTVAHPVGTTIIADDLFFNVPARKKFLKKRETEWRQILQLVHAFCLENLALHIKLSHDGREILNCPPVTTLSDRVAQLWEPALSQNLITIDANHGRKNIHVSGIISNHQHSRFDRSRLYFFVNHRWIKNYTLSRSLLKGYLNVLPPGRYPAAVLFIDVDPLDVDINIHPRKEEVQFLNPRSVEQLLQTTVKEALEKHLSNQISKPVQFATPDTTPAFKPAMAQEYPTTPSPLPFVMPADDPFAPASQPQKTTTPALAASPNPVPQPQQRTVAPQTPTQQKQFNVIGYFKKTYILLEQEDGLFVVDQHAAHERVLYELFSERFDDVATVKLLFPTTINVSTEEMSLLADHLTLFTNNGIAIEPYGEQQLIVTATPVHLKNQPLDDIVHQVAGWIKEEQNSMQDNLHNVINKKLHAQMACKAAVKAHDELQPDQIQQLLRDLYATNNRFTCPHGRPTGWLLSDYEIEKKFKRKN